MTLPRSVRRQLAREAAKSRYIDPDLGRQLSHRENMIDEFSSRKHPDAPRKPVFDVLR